MSSRRDEADCGIATIKTRGAHAAVTFDDDDGTVASRNSAASTVTMSAWEGLWKRHNHSNSNGAGIHRSHPDAPLERPRTPSRQQGFGVTVRSTKKSAAKRHADNDPTASRKDRCADVGPTPKSSGRRIVAQEHDDDNLSLEQFWEDQWSVAHQIHGRLREVRRTLAGDGEGGGGSNNSLRRDVDLLKSLLAIQAAQTERLLEHVPMEDEVVPEMNEPSPSTLQQSVPTSCGIIVDPNRRQREHGQEEEKKADLEDPSPQQLRHPGRHSALAPITTAPDDVGTANAGAVAMTDDGAEWSLLGRLQMQQQQHHAQQHQLRAGFCSRLATLEEVEYESDRTTPSNATTAAAATPATTPASSFPSGARSGNSASRGAAAAPTRTPAEPYECAPASEKTTTPVARLRGVRSTPRQHRHHPSPHSASSYSLTPRSSYVEAPSDEMDSGMWERESNHTIDTYDMSATPRQHAESPSHLLNYQATDHHSALHHASRGSVGGAGGDSYGDSQYDPDDDDDDEYDSALYCATVLASDRDARNALIRSPSDSKGSEAFERHQYDRPESQHPGVHSTPASAFRNKVVLVDYSENQPSPTMTNITMDESEFEDVEEDGGEAKRGVRRNEQDLTYVNDESTEVDDSRDNDSSAHEDDNATTTSQETPVLERYRIDLDDESPHGFTVIPNPRGSRRRTIHGCSPKVGAMVSTSRSPTHRSPATLLQKASMAFDADVGLSSNAKASGNPASGEHEWLASPNHLDALLHQPLSARRRSARKALRKSPYKPPKMVPTTPTIDENAPLACPEDLVGLSSVERHRRRDREYKSFVNCGQQEAPPESSRRLHDEPNESVATRSDPSFMPASSLLYANVQLSLRDANEARRSHRSFDYSDVRRAEPSPGDRKDRAAPVVIPPLTEDEYNNSRCIARSGITLEEAQHAITALNRVLQSRATTPPPGRPGLLPSSVDRSVLRTSNGPVNQGHDSVASPLRTHFREHEAKRILMQALDVSDRKSKTILVGLCHWRRLILRRQSFGGVGAGGGNDSRDGGRCGNDDNGSTSSSTTLSLLLYEVPTTKPRENLSSA